ncbi:hypothetical protein ABET14_12590 [Heyndrickxia coagulans]|jgi:hypothetical protein|uniref:hypothetical protein n=1 Tax=Heyndrickxia TaxID=2837504 RepID=UPI0005A2E597|nr:MULTISPECIES: hypothetical protein [Heyndrickxia]MBF8416910.1 hypothetical protein [Heyndrickxia coagulans]MBQ4912361.1 hypothetical protein [Heyndrickxia faecalis]MED4406719.1 hypothetical protein [Heyndrickxia coagulans]NCG68531.1 hypothetical protein [Heyndrickxia coagulans]UJZ87736.1 hypothetical protein L3V65_01465 [Heyndrickxia coagulans]
MNKKILSFTATILFLLGVILAFFTDLSSIGLILITISIGITCIQLADLLSNKILKILVYLIPVILIITVIVFIPTIY